MPWLNLIFTNQRKKNRFETFFVLTAFYKLALPERFVIFYWIDFLPISFSVFLQTGCKKLGKYSRQFRWWTSSSLIMAISSSGFFCCCYCCTACFKHRRKFSWSDLTFRLNFLFIKYLHFNLLSLKIVNISILDRTMKISID